MHLENKRKSYYCNGATALFHICIENIPDLVDDEERTLNTPAIKQKDKV